MVRSHRAPLQFPRWRCRNDNRLHEGRNAGGSAESEITIASGAPLGWRAAEPSCTGSCRGEAGWSGARTAFDTHGGFRQWSACRSRSDRLQHLPLRRTSISRTPPSSRLASGLWMVLDVSANHSGQMALPRERGRYDETAASVLNELWIYSHARGVAGTTRDYVVYRSRQCSRGHGEMYA
jgi:hypothetical protein